MGGLYKLPKLKEDCYFSGMIHLKPFRALRPPRDKAYLVATRSYLSYTPRQLEEKLKHNPFTFLHVINPIKGRALDYGKEKYQLVKEAFSHSVAEGMFKQDTKECYYLYRQVKDGNEYTGLIAAVAIEDYLAGKIKKHEHTLTQRENMFTDYLETTGFNAEPVLLTYQDDLRIDKVFAQYIEKRSEYEFTSTDKVLHQLWLIEDKKHCDAITKAFKDQKSCYIADGHHRCASSALLANRQSAKKQPAAQFFMALLIGEEQMKVYDFNRLVKNTTSKTHFHILEELERRFLIERKGKDTFKPEKLHEIGMYLKGQWYKLVPKMGTFDPGNAVNHLDADILSQNILAPVFGIKDLKHDERVKFVPGTEGLDYLQEAVNNDKYQVAFALHPVTVEQIKRVSDAGLTMPPKSTYIEPKLRSGLTVYKILD
jgi:uncharacterized protein (DUF1015 family)